VKNIYKVLYSFVFASLIFGLSPLTNPAHASVVGETTYYTKNDGTNFIRSTTPFISGIETQTATSVGSLTVSVNGSTGYADSGVALYEGTLGNLGNFTVTGTGNYSLNLWFDVNNDNEFFAWNSSGVLSGLNGDTYGLGPSSSSSGKLAITNASQFYVLSDGQNHSLANLKSGAVTGISSSTKVAIWLGVSTNSGSVSATITGIHTPAREAVYRPSNGTWYVHQPDGSVTSWVHGNSTDIPVPGDYDGDGNSDYAIFRPSSNQWYIYYANDLIAGHYHTYTFGQSGDKPVPGDYDGDGKTDLAVYRPSNGTWYWLDSSDGVTHSWQHGNSTDIPVIGDYNGDGLSDLAIFRPSDPAWYIYYTSDLTVGNYHTYTFGQSGDVPVPGDYDGDGKTDLAVYRPSNGTWYWLNSSDGTSHSWQHGSSADLPVSGDYDADTLADFSIFRPSDPAWYIYYGNNLTVGDYDTVNFGQSGDIPMAFYATP
jgi:hypothetical protein